MAYSRHKESTYWFIDSVNTNETFSPNVSSYPAYKRGNILFARLGENIGHEKCDERPVMVISNDTINIHGTNILVAVLTKASNYTDPLTGKVKIYRSQKLMNKSDYPFLQFDSIVQFEQTRVISKARVEFVAGVLTKDQMDLFDDAIKFAVGI